MKDITYDVRIYKTEVYNGKRVTSYTVRWSTGGKPWKEPFRNAAQADAFRSELMTAARKGEAFAIATGRPVAWKRQETVLSWYSFTLAYVDAKWPYASPNHRRGIAEALTDATEALFTVESAAADRDVYRAALRWSYSMRVRDTAEPPTELSAALRWLEQHTIALTAFTEPGKGAPLARAVLDRISRTKDGKLAAANTANRKRMVLNNVMEYAREIGALPANPFKAVKWTKPRTLSTVDPRTVINIEQARRFLMAVRKDSRRGERMEAFFGCMYYAALRPEEAVDLRREHLVSLPDDGWGEMRLTNAEPRAGSRWTNSGRPRERRALKHRAEGETRSVPIHPELVTLLRTHLKAYGTGPDGRVFIGPRGGIMTDRAYLKVFHDAREKAFSAAEAVSPLMAVPYALRHAAVSTWLNAGVPAPQVAEWAGHSVDVLLRVYAKCIHGQETEAMRRIWDATKP
ncbi:tyrosine-type recombinase/integrase [Microbispora amethystogenes]|uniref:Integrase n=1 Tax=Microbispora amethystogenes TaxID=1427754 RepID=A0ABQ4FQ12_9ACTN|nr:tyrosine-type recombinase/integrase [Microbispora amethystogenes]GIH36912.1 integrase [Microbispora amethystogenes]